MTFAIKQKCHNDTIVDVVLKLIINSVIKLSINK